MSLRKHALLIVEHDPIIRSLYVRTLARHYEILVAQTVDQVITHSAHPALWAVIIEPHRSDGLGLAYLDAVYQHTRPRHIPVLVCSVLDAQDIPHWDAETCYLVKPIAPESLHEFIERQRSI